MRGDCHLREGRMTRPVAKQECRENRLPNGQQNTEAGVNLPSKEQVIHHVYN